MVKSWHDAQDHCVKEQANLVSFHSEEELSFLTGEQPRKRSSIHPADQGSM